MPTDRRHELALLLGVLAISLAASAALGNGPLGLPLPTTAEDFVQPGTQPETLRDAILPSSDCSDCHGNYDLEVEPYGRWAGSMMAQSTRDPVFHACLTIANQDAANSGEMCLRCHAPVGWLGGRSTPTDGSGLDPAKGDFDGVTCHLCHRLVDPIYDRAANPEEDEGILADLTLPPTAEPHTGQYIIDPIDRRRGPFELFFGFPWHNWEKSPFHREAMLCANCHDVSNPTLSRQEDGSYRLNDLDAQHPTHDKRDAFPIERTFTEWKHSVYARAEIETGGRFGGSKTAVATCQDCHLPDITGTACKPGVGGEERPDMPLHDFNGANSWVLEAVRSLYPDEETGLTDEIVDAAVARNISMLQRAADLEAFQRGEELVARVINRSGHKLPTGYGEGRRMWLNLRFLDGEGTLIEERGHYDHDTATLTTEDTRVYEMHQGLDDYMAGVTELPAGESFHFVLNNTILKDNRIPPRGFVNVVFDEVQAGVVDHVYPDQHFWDDAAFALPAGTATVQVSLFHQTTTREYIEFLRDENHTDDNGQIAYDVWLAGGKSAPVEMATVEVAVGAAPCPTPIPYGLGKIGNDRSVPWLGWNGEPSVSGDEFEITLRGAEPGPGQLVFDTVAAARPWRGGTLLVEEPRVAATFTVAADGTAVIPISLAGRDAAVGEEIYFQAVIGDGQGVAATDLSDGLHVDICQ